MSNRRLKEYVVYSTEYLVGAGIINKPVYLVLAIYKTEKEANDRKVFEEERMKQYGIKGIEFFVEELKVFEKRKKNGLFRLGEKT